MRLLNTRTLNISWSDSANYVSQYSLERRIGSSGSWAVIQTLAPGYLTRMTVILIQILHIITGFAPGMKRAILHTQMEQIRAERAAAEIFPPRRIW